jgi:hypothetical protein
VSVLEALRSWRYGKAQLSTAVRRAQSRSAVNLALTTGVCIAAMVLIVMPLLTLEADARGGGGGGGGGHGGGGGGQSRHPIDCVQYILFATPCGLKPGRTEKNARFVSKAYL